MGMNWIQAIALALMFTPFAMALRLANATRSAACNAVVDLLDSGTIQIRTGAQPTNPDDAAAGSLLGTLTFNATAFGAASNGAATANAITSDTSADLSGTAAHARILTSGAAIHSDCTCGQGTGDINFDNNVIVAGGVIAISGATWTQPV
jgi:hypothetical protein